MKIPDRSRASSPMLFACWIFFLSGSALADDVPANYQTATKDSAAELRKGKDQPHDDLVADAVALYQKKYPKCTIYVADTKYRDSTTDLIVTCVSDQCPNKQVILIEVKAGKSSDAKGKTVDKFDKAVSQLDAAARAINQKLKPKPKKECYSSVILIPDKSTLTDAGKLTTDTDPKTGKYTEGGSKGDQNPNWTQVGNNEWVLPDVTNNLDKLPGS